MRANAEVDPVLQAFNDNRLRLAELVQEMEPTADDTPRFLRLLSEPLGGETWQKNRVFLVHKATSRSKGIYQDEAAIIAVLAAGVGDSDREVNGWAYNELLERTRVSRLAPVAAVIKTGAARLVLTEEVSRHSDGRRFDHRQSQGGSAR